MFGLYDLGAMLAAAIVLVTVLYLVDKNKVWPQFWKVVGGCILFVVLLGGGYYFYDLHEAKAAASGPWHDYAPSGKPVTLDMSTAQPIVQKSVTAPATDAPAPKTSAK